MSNTLTFTQSAFLEGKIFSTATTANVSYDILSATTADRRIYGISVASTDAGAQTIKLYLNDGSSEYQLYTYSLAANAGNSTTITAADLFGDTKGSSIFQKQRDANGVPYFNLPANWSVRLQYGTALATVEHIDVLTFGETY